MTIDWTLTWNTVLAISTALMAIAIVVTAIFAIVQLWNVKKTRCSDLLMRLDQIWDSNDFIHSRSMINQHAGELTLEEASKSLKELLVSLDKTNAEDYFIMVRIANFFENLGFLVCIGYLNHKDAYELFGASAERYWKLFSEFTNYRRYGGEPKQRDAWIYFESLGTRIPKENRCLIIIKTPIRKIRRRFSKNANQ